MYIGIICWMARILYPNGCHVSYEVDGDKRCAHVPPRGEMVMPDDNAPTLLQNEITAQWSKKYPGQMPWDVQRKLLSRS